MDFTKYNKGLRFYATLFNINPDVFNTDYFIDIEVIDNELRIYYNKLYDQYIINLLINNNYYYNNYISQFRQKQVICYTFKYTNTEVSSNIILDCLNKNSNYLIPDIFYIKVCIHWKKYLDNTFITLVSNAYQLNKQQKRSVEIQTFIIN